MGKGGEGASNHGYLYCVSVESQRNNFYVVVDIRPALRAVAVNTTVTIVGDGQWWNVPIFCVEILPDLCDHYLNKHN